MYGIIKRKVNIHDKEETSLQIKKTMVGANWKDVSEEKSVGRRSNVKEIGNVGIFNIGNTQ